jgi:hypothetical protein
MRYAELVSCSSSSSVAVFITVITFAIHYPMKGDYLKGLQQILRFSLCSVQPWRLELQVDSTSQLAGAMQVEMPRMEQMVDVISVTVAAAVLVAVRSVFEPGTRKKQIETSRT